MSVNRDVSRRLKSYLFTPMFMLCVMISVGVGVAFSSSYPLVGGLYRYQAGVPYMFVENVDLKRVIEWMIPHLLVSLIVGRQTEESLGTARYELPRYQSPMQWWLRVNLAAYGLIVLFYLLIFGSLWGVSVMGGRAYSAEDWSIWLSMIAQIMLTMAALMTGQMVVHLYTQRSIYAAGAFFLVILLSVFLPSQDSARYAMGSWMMYCRSQVISGECGYAPQTVLLGNLGILCLEYGCVYILFRFKRNLW
ncbi:MAG: hypothetical protein RR296_10585 [Clostridia bacterium]